MEEIVKNRYCEKCKKETSHIVREDGLEIEYRCTVCHTEQDIVKSFF
jgi:ribosomal protein L44E